MILARLAIYGAIMCTLWWNSSYAWSKGGTEVQQYGMVATAITIDLCKCGFLTAASHLWRNSWKFPAVVLVLLWPLTFAYSAFSGFASITTNRTATTSVTEGHAQQRTRDQAAYDQAAAALKLAMTSPLWATTTACTSPKTTKQREFCENIATTKSQQEAARAALNASTPAHVDPEVTVLKDNTNLPTSTLLLLIAGAPALILELVSSLGFYAINRRPSPKPSQKPVEGISRFWKARGASAPKTVPEACPVVSDAAMERPSLAKPQPTPSNSKLDWTVP